jgi:hypothetical protein
VRPLARPAKELTHDTSIERMSKESWQSAISSLTYRSWSEKLFVFAREPNTVCLLFLQCALSLNSWTGVQILKCIEGLHNKAFILTMDNGAQVFAKLPNPNAGPACYTTASEVATRQMVCTDASLRTHITDKPSS